MYLLTWRLAHGLTCAELADRVGVPYFVILRLEAGRLYPDKGTAARLEVLTAGAVTEADFARHRPLSEMRAPSIACDCAHPEPNPFRNHIEKRSDWLNWLDPKPTPAGNSAAKLGISLKARR